MKRTRPGGNVGKKQRDRTPNYPGRDDLLSTRSGPIMIEQAPGRPDLVKVNLNVAMAAPDVAMFADFVRVERQRDGVRLLFGKLNPFDRSQLVQAAEISFPFRPFVNQLYASVSQAGPGHRAPFIDSVRQATEMYGYDRIAEDSLPQATNVKDFVAFRSNFVFMALHEDDAAIDFFHLDAATVQLALQNRSSGPGFRGVLRVVLSPTLLSYFLEKTKELAIELEASIPRIKDSPTVEVLP